MIMIVIGNCHREPISFVFCGGSDNLPEKFLLFYLTWSSSSIDSTADITDLWLESQTDSEHFEAQDSADIVEV